MSSLEASEVCPICHETMEISHETKKRKHDEDPESTSNTLQNVVTSCNHTFHPFCISDWMKIKETCPLCQKDLSYDLNILYFYALDKYPKLFDSKSDAYNNEVFVTEMVKDNSKLFKYASDNLKGKSDFLLKLADACFMFQDVFEHAPDELKDSKDFLREVAKICRNQLPEIFGHVSDNVKNNFNFVCELIKCHPYIGQHASSDLRSNEEIMRIALLEEMEWCEARSFSFASEDLKANKQFFRELIEINPYALEYASPEIQDDDEIVSKVVESNGFCFLFASYRLKNNFDLTLKAIGNSDGSAFQHASDELQDNFDLNLAAIKVEVCVMQYMSDKFLHNRDILLAGAKNNNHYCNCDNFFDMLPDKFCDDEEIMVAAVKTHPQALEHMSERLLHKFELEAIANK